MQRQITLEAQEQVLAMGIDRAHRSSLKSLWPALWTMAWVGGEDLLRDASLEDRPDAAGYAVDRVALGHGSPRWQRRCRFHLGLPAHGARRRDPNPAYTQGLR